MNIEELNEMRVSLEQEIEVLIEKLKKVESLIRLKEVDIDELEQDIINN